MDPMFRAMLENAIEPRPRQLVLPHIYIDLTLKRSLTTFGIYIIEDDQLDILDRLASAITGKQYDHQTRSNRQRLELGDDCFWFYEAHQLDPFATVLVRHSADPYSFLVLVNTPLALRVVLYGEWEKSRQVFEKIAGDYEKHIHGR